MRKDSLVLRPFVPKDLDKVFEALSHPLVIKHYGVSYATRAATREQMDWFAAIERDNTGRWRAVCSPDGVFYGAIGFNNWSAAHRKAEVGFWLLPGFWGRGIMTAALSEICDYGFTVMNLHRIEAEVETGNTASRSLLLKSGFKYEGTRVDCEIKNGAFISLELFAKIKPRTD